MPWQLLSHCILPPNKLCIDMAIHKCYFLAPSSFNIYSKRRVKFKVMMKGNGEGDKKIENNCEEGK